MSGRPRGRPYAVRLSLIALALLGRLAVPAPGQAQDGVFPPLDPADAANGLAIFQARCAGCHGALGGGDGQLAGQLPTPPPAFNLETYARALVPAEHFATITNGRLDQAMPPFGPASSDPLSERARWDAVAAILSLGLAPASVAAGETIYEATCAACHGPAGDALPEANLAAPATWAVISGQALFDRLDEPIDGHDFTLDDESRWAVADYARTLAFNYADPAILTAPIETAVVTGRALNGTSGAPLTAGVATLRAFDGFQLASTYTTTLDADGAYQFTLRDVPRDRAFLVQVGYKGFQFGSQLSRMNPLNATLELPVTVYETTTDIDVVSVDRLNIVLEFGDGAVRVNELYQFSNNSRAVYVVDGGTTLTGVAVVLPDNAQAPVFQRSFGSLQDFLPAEDLRPSGARWQDPTPLFPGTSTLTLLARYELPYDDGASFTHQLLYPAREITLILPDVGVEVTHPAWIAATSSTLPEGDLHTFSHPELAPGESVAITLNGRLRDAPAAGSAVLVRDTSTELLVGGAALLVSLGVVAYVVRGWRRATGEEPYAREALLTAVAALDEAYEAGALTDASYAEQRAALFEELAAVWEAPQ